MRAALAAAALLLLAACAADGEAAAPPGELSTAPAEAATGGGPGVYQVATPEGGRISVHVPADPSDERLAGVRAVVPDGMDVTYLIAEVDNMDGAAEVYIEHIAVTADNGQAIEVPYVASGSDGSLLEDLDSAAATDAANALLNKEQVGAGEYAELIYATTDEIPSVARVSLPITELGEEMQAVKAG